MPGPFVSPGRSASPFLGVLTEIRTPNPVAGADFEVKLPGGAWYRFVCARFTLVADANVANRFLRVAVKDPDRTRYVTGTTVAVVAGETAEVVGVAGYVPNNLSTPTKVIGFTLPDMVYPGGWKFTLTTASIQVGDQYDAGSWTFEEIDLGPYGSPYGEIPFPEAELTRGEQ